MSIAIDTSASSLQALELWQSTVAHNLANSSIPGFQQTLFSISGANYKNDRSAVTNGNGLIGAHQRSTVPGAIKVTGNPTDFAIHGEGYFSVQGQNGEQLYTRNGEFHLDPEGVLVNTQGLAVTGAGGPITVDLGLGPVSVASDGTASQGGQQIGKLSVYRFEDTVALKQLKGGALFADPDAKAGAQVLEYPTVYQGQLEMSNVSPMREMVSMIEIARAYEMTQKVIQQVDEREEKTIQAFSS